MEKNRIDKFSDLVLKILKPLIIFLMKRQFNMKITMNDSSIKDRKEPFILIGNHVTDWDPFLIAHSLNYPIRFVANTVTYLGFWEGIGLGPLTQSIKKRKGKADFKTIKDIIKNIKKGYSIGIFPEGNRTFFGETEHIYYSTAKLFKSMKVDVISCVIRGGYFSSPRWSNYNRKKGRLELEYVKLFTKEQLKEQSVDEIYERLVSNLTHNEYAWQKKNMIKYECKDKSSGVDRMLYLCPRCEDVFSIYGKENSIICENCGEIGYIDDYEFIQNCKFNNFVDWEKYQAENVDILMEKCISMNVVLKNIDFKNMNLSKIGKYTLEINNDAFLLKNNKDTYKFYLHKIKNSIITKKTSFTFDYEDKSYMINTYRPVILLDIIKNRGVKHEGMASN